MLQQHRPVSILAPRWSEATHFLESLSLAGFHTIPTHWLTGHTEQEIWNLLLQSVTRLQDSEAPAPFVMDRRAFREGMAQAIQSAHPDWGLIITGAEKIPLEILADFSACWGQYTPNPLVVCSSLETPALLPLLEGDPEDPIGPRWVELPDLSEAEAIALLLSAAGKLPNELLAYAVRFTGGVPALVHSIGKSLLNHWPSSSAEWWEALGPAGEDLKAAVEVALASPDLAERVFILRDGRPRAMEQRDRSLLLAGLLRRLHHHGPPRVQLRAHAIAMLASPEW
jgi:hypothetical protein